MMHMTGNKSLSIWFLFTTIVSIFNICTIRIFAVNWPLYVVTANAVISLFGLILHMHLNGELAKNRLVKVLRALLLIDSACVFLMTGLSIFIMSSQYHNPLEPDMIVSSAGEIEAAMQETDKAVTVFEADDLYVFYPNYSDIEFVSGERPSKSEGSADLCIAAAFQATYNLRFVEDEVVGWHSINGRLERGKPEMNLGAFTYVEGNVRIWNVDEAEEAVKNVAASGGTGYQQFIVLYDGERGGHDSDEFRCYRVLAILNERACIIDSKTQMHYGDFISSLEKLGVRYALYCDMGSGWNYSWYRDENGRAVDIIGTPWPFSHNWLVFK